MQSLKSSFHPESNNTSRQLPLPQQKQLLTLSPLPDTAFHPWPIQQVLFLCQTVPGFKCKKLFPFSPGWSSTFIALTASYFQPLSNLCPFPIFQVPGAYLPAISAYISSVTQTQHTHINLENYNAYIIHFLPEYIPFNSYSQYPLLTKALIIFHF